MGGGDFEAAYALFSQAIEVAERFNDRDLLALGRLGQGRTLVKGGETSRGLTLLDEAMVAITAGEVGAVVAGIVFCAVIETCRDAFDVRRAQEWTVAMTRWCAAQPDLVAYRGHCSVYRAEVLRLHGEWDEALKATATTGRASRRELTRAAVTGLSPSVLLIAMVYHPHLDDLRDKGTVAAALTADTTDGGSRT